MTSALASSQAPKLAISSPSTSTMFISRLPRYVCACPAMLAPAMRPCSMAVGSMACSAGSPVTASRPSATSPAAYTLGTLERMWASTTMPRLMVMPESCSQSRLVRMPVAMMIWSAITSSPC